MFPPRQVAYEKGYQFLYYLESVVGQDLFEQWFKQYIKDFWEKTLLSEDFKRHFIDWMSQVSARATLRARWLLLSC